MDGQNFVQEKNYRLDILFDDFTDKFPDFKRYLTQRTFNRWIKFYLQHKNWKTYESKRTDGKEFFHKRDSGQYFTLV